MSSRVPSPRAASPAALGRAMNSTLLRFGLVGLANTALGYGIICIALFAGLGDFGANALGYGAGLLLSFQLNRRWTFAGRGGSLHGDAAAFLVAWIVAYAINLMVIAAARAMGWIDNPLVHLAGIPAFSGSFYLLSNHVVFRKTGAASIAWPSVRLSDCALPLLAIGTFAALWNTPLTHDVAWQFWIARQMIGGAALYRDIWELNPPLWFWSAVPVEQAALVLGISARTILVGIVVAMGALSAGLTGHLSGIERGTRRTVLMLAAFWFCVPMPLFDFGQREQFALICALPYVALTARRSEGKTVSLALALFIGLFAAYGLALKHYFVIVPVVLEGWLILQRGKSWRPLRPETVMLGGCALLYGVSVLLFAPDFLSRIVPMVSAAYRGYEVPFIFQIDEPAQLAWLLAGIGLMRLKGVFGRGAMPLVTALALAGIAFMIGYFAQLKGWQYHAVPVTGMLLLAVVARLTQERPAMLWRYPLCVAALCVSIGFGAFYGRYNDFLRPASGPILETVAPGESVAALAADPMWIWPIAEERGLVWPLRLYSYWMLPAIGHDQMAQAHDPALAEVSRQVHDQTIEDLRCNPPALIMIEVRRRYLYQPEAFEPAAFFLSDKRLRDFMRAHYAEEQSTTRWFRVFRRKGPVAGSHEAGCRHVTPLSYTLPRS